jgi:penicillin-binding protein 2
VRRGPRPEIGSSDRTRLRVVVLRVLVVSLLVTLAGRLWVLQVLDGDRYRAAATGNRVRAVVTPATRGLIVDDQGRPLVQNRTSLVISVNRSVTDRQRDGGKAVLARLAPVVGMPAAEIARRIQFCGPGVKQPCWNGSPYQPIPVAKDVTPARALEVIEHPERFPGVSADLQAVRQYPDGSLAGHELGYLAPVTQAQVDSPTGKKLGYHENSLVGASGVESTYDTDLRGTDGVQELEVDRYGRVSGVRSSTAPRSGDNLVLSLDAGVQNLVEQSLRATVDSLGGGAHAASAVVLNAKNGQVIAMASLPSYDPSVFVGGISEKDYQALSDPANGTPLLSRAFQGSGSPGSTFKPVVSTSTAMTELGATGDDTYSCSPTLQVGSQTFHNFDGESAGNITLHQALVISCDVIFDKFAYDAWLADGGLRNGRGPYPPAKEYFVNMAKAYGFGKRTGLDLPGETAGAVVGRSGARDIWNELKASYCRRAKNGYPDEPDPAKAERYRQYAVEACADGYLYNGGAATQFAIGQGQYLSVSPLQLAVGYAAIANGGTVYEPHLAKAVLGPDGQVVRTIAPVVTDRVPVAPATLAYIRSALAGVTTEPGGTATGVFADWPSAQIPVAGKTGTAEVEGHKDTSWFASFAPANDPQYVVVVSIPESGQGALFAAPVAKEIYQGIFGVGRPALLPAARPPAGLPRVNPDGTIGAPVALTGPPPAAPGGAAVAAADPAVLGEATLRPAAEPARLGGGSASAGVDPAGESATDRAGTSAAGPPGGPGARAAAGAGAGAGRAPPRAPPPAAL